MTEQNATPHPLRRLLDRLPHGAATALAARAGLSLSNVDVISGASGSDNPSSGILSAPAENPVGSVDLSLSALGAYPALQDFLRNIEKSQRLLDVQDLTVKGSNTGLYTYQMKIRLYWLR